MKRKYEAQGVRFLAVSIEPDAKLVRSAAERLGLTMTVGISLRETLTPLYVNQVPSTVWVDAQGIIVMAASGEQTQGFFDRRTRALLGDK